MSEQNNRDQRGDGNNAARSSSSSDKRDDRGRPATNDRNAPKRFEDRKPSFGGRPARDGERKSFGDRGASSERKPYSKDRKPSFGDRPARSDDDRRPPRDGERKPFSERSGERKSFGDRKPAFGDRGDRKPSFGGDDRRPPRDGERKSFSDRGDRKPAFGDRGDRKPAFGDRPARGGDDRRPARDNDRKPSFGDRKPSFGGDDRRPPRDGERKSFGDRGDRKPSFGDRGDRKPSFGDRGDRKPSFGDRGDRKPSFGGDDRRPPRDGERKSFGDRGDRKPSFGDRKPSFGGDDRRPPRDGERKSFGDRGDRKPSFGDRGDRKPSFGDRPARGGDDRRPARDSAPRSFSKDRPARGEDAPVVEHKHNARDLRSANRPDRERSPEIDDDVTGQELDKVTRAQLRILEEVNGEWVSKHLVMAGRLIDIDPELAFQHALAASRRGGRMAAVREAVALTAYASENFAEALREFRTYRRISGSNAYLAMMADCERGLGRPDRALDISRSDEAKELDTAGQVDMAIVASGARMDMEQYDAAVTALEIPQLDKNRAFSFSPRLFRAYADALELADRNDEAEQWRKRALLAEKALGIGEFAEPDIYDLDDEEDKPEKPRRGREDRDREGREDHRGAERSETPFAAPVETETVDANGELDLTDDVDNLPSDEQEGVIGVLEAEEDDDDNAVELQEDGNDNDEFSADAPAGDTDEDRA
ncbi:hypothetical protein [Arthrobacter gengyunqii]|uniref:Tetratricopeptide repeat protein n=1 Tax=Arthrobacter gengyunqii TaxID=2886940 RepID=A0ABS8GCW7_9MICC|nr:hypothetical protein [Arthrobacter gengyunqii]MCC3264435.1 hypothetical protein [Arthrobacter gengyunqii]